MALEQKAQKEEILLPTSCESLHQVKGLTLKVIF